MDVVYKTTSLSYPSGPEPREHPARRQKGMGGKAWAEAEAQALCHIVPQLSSSRLHTQLK